MTSRRSLLGLSLLATALAIVPALHAQATSATQAARRLLDATPVAQRASLLRPFADMDATQQPQALKLIGGFAEHLQPELAEARLARVRAAPLEAIRIGWAGSLKAGEPHYFRVQGAGFLIEFDNSGGNHIHSVWRDFDACFADEIEASPTAPSPSTSSDSIPCRRT